MNKIAILVICITTVLVVTEANSSTTACELDVYRMPVVFSKIEVSEPKMNGPNNNATLPVSLAEHPEFSLSTGSADSLIGLLVFYNMLKDFTKSKKE